MMRLLVLYALPLCTFADLAFAEESHKECAYISADGPADPGSGPTGEAYQKCSIILPSVQIETDPATKAAAELELKSDARTIADSEAVSNARNTAGTVTDEELEADAKGAEERIALRKSGR